MITENKKLVIYVFLGCFKRKGINGSMKEQQESIKKKIIFFMEPKLVIRLKTIQIERIRPFYLFLRKIQKINFIMLILMLD